MGGTSKYAKLATLLGASGANVVELTFAEVASVVPDGLPESAFRYRTWWTSNTDASAQSRHGWTRAGYRVSQVDLANRVVTFVQHPCCSAAMNPAEVNPPEAIPTRIKLHAAEHPTTNTDRRGTLGPTTSAILANCRSDPGRLPFLPDGRTGR